MPARRAAAAHQRRVARPCCRSHWTRNGQAT